LLRRAIAAGRFILQKLRFAATAAAKSAFQSKNKYSNASMIDSNNAGSWKVVARFLGKRVTICTAAGGGGHAMLAEGYRGSRK
jgi:hypothetical protein